MSASFQRKDVKIFLNHVDLYQNFSIAQYLVNEYEYDAKYLLGGTIYDHEGIGIAEFKRQMAQCLFKTSYDFIERIIEHDIIIYDIGPDPEEISEVEKVLDGLEKYYEERKDEPDAPMKYFILISTPLTWSTTEARNEDGLFYESEYRRRRAHVSYTKHKYCERYVNLFEKKMEGKCRTLIVCPGYTYGGANDTFHYIFKLSFFDKKKVPIIEPGHQTYPLIYITDYARMMVEIIKNFPPPETRYIFAVQPNNWTFKAFTRAIVRSISGNITRVGIVPKSCLMKYPVEVFPQRVIDAISNPIKLVPQYFKDFQYTFDKIEEIGKILAEEYRIERNLSPIKILIDGPPLSGKSTIAKELAEFYNINYIDPLTVVQIVMNRLQRDINAADKLLFNLEREKIEIGNEEDSEVQQLEEEVKEQKEEWQEFLLQLTNHMMDHDKDGDNVPNYRMKCLKRLLGIKLYSENQGYVIDGFPYTYMEAVETFYDQLDDENVTNEIESDEVKVNEEENEEEEKTKFSITLPNFVILLDASDELIWQRGMQLTLEEAVRTGNSEEDVCKRLDEFRKRDEHEDTSLTTFFFDNNINPLSITITDDTKYNALIDIIKSKVGQPHTYPLTPFEKTKLKNAERDKQIRADKEFERKQKEVANRIRIEREEKLRKWTKEFEALKREEELSAEAKTLPLRQYLSKFVLPTLTEGILEVTRIKPEDPVDYLAEFLFKNNVTGHVLSDTHAQEMKRLLLDEGRESVLNILDNYILNENEFKCTDFLNEPSTSKK